jgi:class 3 adenylate cyclase
MATLPEGTVTFLFTDIEGSTRLLQSLGDGYADVLDTHHRLLRTAFARGTEVGTKGDAFFVAFPVATDAVAAAVDAQRALASQPWPPSHPVRVRMGLHTGRATVGPDGYVGLDVH